MSNVNAFQATGWSSLSKKLVKTARKLTLTVLVLAAIASAGGLALHDLYRDTPFYKLLWQTNDGVTLVLIVPLLAASLYFAKLGSQQAQLLWMGLLAYLFYNYAFYLFGAAFNWFFLLYVALFSLSLYALAIGLWRLDLAAISNNFNRTTPVKWIAAFLVFMALPLAVVEIGQCLNFIFMGKQPSAPPLIFALDLAFVVPNMVLAAALLWRRRAWGFVLAAIMLVKGATYGAVLSLNSIRLAFSSLPEKDALLPFYLFVLLGSLLFGGILMKNLQQP